MAAGDYWSAYRKDHARWRAENPNAGTYDYPGNPALGIRSDAEQLRAMSGNNTTPLANDYGLSLTPKLPELIANDYGLSLTPEYVNPNEETTAAGIVPYVGDAGRGSIFEEPGARERALLESYIGENAPAPEIPLDAQTAITDYGPLFQAKADQMMANLTEEELRDGLFLEPQLKIVDGKVVGKMGIPDVFLQDKSPIEPRSTLFDDPFEEFDPDNPYREPDRGDNFVWQDKFGEYHNQWDDMGLETYIPGSYDEDFMSGKSATEAQEEFYNSQQVENEKAAEATRLRDIKAQEEQAKYIKDQMEARDAVLAEQQRQEQIRQNEESARQLLAAQAAAQAKAKAEAEAKAKAAAVAAAAAAQAAAQAQEYETGPVDTPNIFTSTPEPSSFSNYNDDYSNYTNSYFSGGFW
jgi:hypothetical protein